MKTIHDEQVAFDLNEEGLLPIREVPKYLANIGGRRVHVSTVYRWLTAGTDGRRLEAIKLGGQTFTSKPALARFAEAVSQ